MNPKTFRLLSIILAILVVLTIIVYATRNSGADNTKHKPLTAQQIKEIPDAGLSSFVGGDVIAAANEANPNGKIDWKQMPKARQVCYLHAAIGEPLLNTSFLQTYGMGLYNNGATLDDLADAYATIGCKAVADAMHEASALAASSACQEAVAKQRELMLNSKGGKPTANPFDSVEKQFRKAVISDVLVKKLGIYIREHTAEIAAPETK